MRPIIFILVALALSIGVFSCRPKQPATEAQHSVQDKYIAAMGEVGCNNIIDESSQAAQDIYKKHGISYDDIKQFRQSSDAATMTTVAGEIAKRVVACH